ncbi:MAG: hypothetical protein AB7Y46_16420 [Armatimonadota bacterium]
MAARSDTRKHRQGALTASVLVVAGLVLATSIAAAARIRWHDSFEEALAAATQSHKPILVFAYLSQPGGAYDLAHDRMLHETLVDTGVAEVAAAFEAVQLDVRRSENAAARRRLRVSPVVSGPTGVIEGESVAAYPVTLFLDHSGKELYRRSGWLPPEAYRVQLERARALFAGLDAVTAAPGDAVARRNLGRAYMEMDFAPGDRFHRAALENLERAVSLDPQNETGANFDARVDLAILRMPDDPQKGVEELGRLKQEDRDGHRRLEIEYYMAVAQFVLENVQEALAILSRFETDDRSSPYFDSEWTPQALGLLKYIRTEVLTR